MVQRQPFFYSRDMSVEYLVCGPFEARAYEVFLPRSALFNWKYTGIELCYKVCYSCVPFF